MQHRCQQPAPSASPEKHQQVPARTTSLRGVVATEDTDLPNGPKRRAGPRQSSAQVALAFLQLALLPQVSTGEPAPTAASCPKSVITAHRDATGEEWECEIKSITLCGCQVHKSGFFSQ